MSVLLDDASDDVISDAESPSGSTPIRTCKESGCTNPIIGDKRTKYCPTHSRSASPKSQAKTKKSSGITKAEFTKRVEKSANKLNEIDPYCAGPLVEKSAAIADAAYDVLEKHNLLEKVAKATSPEARLVAALAPALIGVALHHGIIPAQSKIAAQMRLAVMIATGVELIDPTEYTLSQVRNSRKATKQDIANELWLAQQEKAHEVPEGMREGFLEAAYAQIVETYGTPNV